MSLSTSTSYDALSPTSSDESLSSKKTCFDPSPENITVIEPLGVARFPVFLAFSPSQKKHYALKFFELEDNQYFLNEMRFFNLNHRNVISILHGDPQTSFPIEGEDFTVSCIVMEYAPYGDLLKLVGKLKGHFTEKLARMYFRQLIDGLEYLHSVGVHHLDIKLDNLLIGENGQLKIADFDLSYIEGDEHVLSRGTKHYRAPELKARKSSVGSGCDIYAAGVVLFLLKCQGVLPHMEEKLYKKHDLLELLNTDTEAFFDTHIDIQERKKTFFSEEFKELFVAMTREDVKERISIEEIKKSKWYLGPVYSPMELKHRVRQFFTD